ncbi:hypothetical protein [Paenibacillus sp. NPDC058071]|uniref:hypothetical protein n=1 Tax=Paenibacillus sp. NPDC058071 TaxID=3346326 RepID=UPI0036DBCBD1
MYISKSNENWISVLHSYFVWGTVKRFGKALSLLTEEPVMTGGYMNEEIFELSLFQHGDIQAEKTFCEPWTRDDYGFQEECQNEDYLHQTLDIQNKDKLNGFISLTSPEQAVNKLSELTNLTIWSDFEWVPYEEYLSNQFERYEFQINNT